MLRPMIHDTQCIKQIDAVFHDIYIYIIALYTYIYTYIYIYISGNIVGMKCRTDPFMIVIS